MKLTRGERFGRWTAMEDHSTSIGKVQCRCDCGTEKLVNTRNLKSGASRSCGCQNAERFAARRTHGVGYDDYRYRAWQTIKGKCLCETHVDWPYYGGRGIQMYDAWANDFPAFAQYLDETLGPRPNGLTLDRINNEGHYEPGNLRWATRSQQAQNRRGRWRDRHTER
jgi:hypothetical protein